MSTLVVHDTPIIGGQHKQVLDALMQAYGETYEVVNVVPKMADKELKKLKPEDWLQHSARILEASRKHDKILSLGPIASATVFQSDVAKGITKVRGRGFWAPNGKFTVCSFTPGTVVMDTDRFRDLAHDVEKLCTQDAPQPVPEIETVRIEYKKDLALLKDLHGATFLGCDTETTGIGTYGAEVLGIGFAALNEDDSGYVVVVPYELIGKEVLKFLQTYKGRFVFHNAKFDIKHIWNHYGQFEFQQNPADTMLMQYTLDERPTNRYRHLGLKLLSRLYFDAPEYDISIGEWLYRYFKEDPPAGMVEAFLEGYCNDHPEKARKYWREAYELEHGEEPNWRGKRVGRDIDIHEVMPYIPLPKEFLSAPDAETKAEMWDEMLRYMGEDCYHTARLYQAIKERMDEESPRLWDYHNNLLIPVCLAFAKMELAGVRVNIPHLKQMKVHIEEVLEHEMAEIRKIVGAHTEHPKAEEFNPNSSKQVREALYNAGDEGGLGLKMPKDVGRYAHKRAAGEVTTNSDTLKVLARQVAPANPAAAKLISLILSYRVKSKILGTYINGLLSRVDPDDRIRGDFNEHGTATGRTSCSNPNLQNIPDASHVGYDIRKAYIPADGCVLLEADYSQLELRVAGLFSQDQVLIEAYRGGADIHQEVALMLWNKPKDQISKYERYLAKCMNFGVIYGRGARSIATGPEMDNLVEMSGRSWTNAEIDAYFAKFKVGYKDLFTWMDEVKVDSLKKQFVENPVGHRRRFDLILNSERGHVERQAVNTPIQGFAAQMTTWAIVCLTEKFEQLAEKHGEWIARVIFTVHDSIMVECLAAHVREVAATIKETMENDLPTFALVSLPQLGSSPYTVGQTLEYNLPFVADVVAGPSWGECKDEAEHYVVTTLAQELGEDEEPLELVA